MSKGNNLPLCLVLACLEIGCWDPDNEEPPPPIARSLEPSSVPSLPRQSAGVFIGVEKFRHLNGNQDVLYAVNDAIDLAYALSIEHRLLPVNRVRLLLSGEPSGGSVERLAELMNADALTGPATKAAITTALEEQARLVESNGVLYVFLATHGYFDGNQYFLTQDSSLDSQDTALGEEEIFAITQIRSGGQTLLIQDTCRTAFTPAEPRRAAGPADPDSRSAAPLGVEKALARRQGYAVLLATGPGKPAWPDPERRNGFFTGALLDRLHCEEVSTKPTVISVAELSSLVQMTVKTRSKGRQGAQLLTAEGFRDFPLVRCGPIAEIIEPRAGDTLCVGSGVARVRVHQPGFYATAVLYAERAKTYFHEQPDFTTPAEPGWELRLPVEYGAPDNFQVYVGLSSDRDFLVGKEQISQLFPEDHRGHPVYWLGPVAVAAKEHVLKGDCQ